MACAHAAGVAALWWEYLRSRKTGGEVTSRMVTAEMLKAARTGRRGPGGERDIDRGAGLLQAPPAR